MGASPSLSNSDLEQWRANPVTGMLREALERTTAQAKAAALEAYWSGRPWPEADRLALKRQEMLLEDLFRSSADDVMAILEMDDAEHQRDHPR